MQRPARMIVVVAMAAAALSVACTRAGGSAEERRAASGAAGASAAAVNVKLFMFDPDPLQIPAGTTVTWTNDDEILHTVTAGTRTYDEQGQTEALSATGEFDLPLDGRGSTARFTFQSPGTIAYLCTVHPGMDAEVIVS